MLKSFLAALLLTTSSTGVRAFAPCDEGFSEISVENVNGVFCVTGSTICASDISQGACSAVQEGLAYGSYCGVVASSVYGCKALGSESVKTFQPWVEPSSTPAPTTVETPAPTSAETPAPTTAGTPAPSAATPTIVTCENGGSPVSVEGVDGAFCTIGSPVCSGEYAFVHFSRYSDPTATTNSPSSTPSASPTPATTTPAPATTTPTPSTTTTTTTSTVTTISSADCPSGGSPVSIEGVQKIFCVTGIACAADIATGNCPGKQEGLPFGSFCDAVRTGVYGCIFKP